MKKIFILQVFLGSLLGCQSPSTQTAESDSKLKALILDGQNNHYVWPKTTQMMKSYLEDTELFTVDVNRTDSVWLGRKYNPNRPEAYEYFFNEFPIDSIDRPTSSEPINTSNFTFDFGQYDLIISNLGELTPTWPKETREAIAKFVADGGGFMVIHAANNAWGDWPEFNEIIGLGAWGDRDSTSGPFVFYDDAGELQKDYSAGICGSHGAEQEYVLTTRAPEHPIMKGLPAEWLHTKDEMYDRMRGPFLNATILATAFSDSLKNTQSWEPVLSGTNKHVPTLIAIEYGKGRVFHSALGHFDYSQECVGFITTLQRGAEWAATGQVTQRVPLDFPTKEKASARKWTR